MLTVSNIIAEHDKQLILSIDNATLSYGQFNVLTGPSGAGKSTFLQTISGQLIPAKGQICWQQHTLYDLSESARSHWRNKNIGFIFQDFHLLPSLSALDNVLLPYSFSHYSMPATLREQALMLLDDFNIQHVHKNINKFSRGEKQRIALARAFIGDPDIILADEPTASLDKENAQFVIEQLKAKAASGKFVLVVSHDPLIINQAEQVLTLNRGVIQK